MSNEKKGEMHHHEMEFIVYTSVHVHGYSTPTSENDGHHHIVQGYTSGSIASVGGHVHYYEGTTTLADGHVHHFRGYTGPSVMLPDGSHYHVFSGETSSDHGHFHQYRGRTGPAQFRYGLR
jgi:hypothetical protein